MSAPVVCPCGQQLTLLMHENGVSYDVAFVHYCGGLPHQVTACPACNAQLDERLIAGELRTPDEHAARRAVAS